jgi:hypothetical protein
MEKEFARYVEELSACAAGTHRSEDRELYERYLAHASRVLAAIVTGKSKPQLSELIAAHDRLWGQTWLHDPIFDRASTLYAQFKSANGFDN